MKKFIIALALAAAPVLGFSAPVFADSPGELAVLTDAYVVRNVTKNGSYSSSVAATCNETVKFSLKLSNSEYGRLDNVTVKANLNGGVSASATNAANEATGITSSVSVNVTKGTLNYVPGSTVNLDVNGALIKTLADGIVAGGVNKGSLQGSTREFVQFQAKVNCDTPVVKDIKVCEVATGNIVTIKEDDYDSSKYSKDMSDCDEEEVKEVASVTELPKTGAGSVMLAGLGLGAMVVGGAYALQRRNILG